MILSNFRVKSPITKIKENNIFEYITYRSNILLLVYFVFDFQNKKKTTFKWCLNCFETIFRQIDMLYPQKYYSLSFYLLLIFKLLII